MSGDGVGSVFTSAVGAGEQGRRPEGIRAVIAEGEAGARPGLPGVRVNMEGPGAGAERALPALKMAPRSRDGGGGERSWARGCVRVAWRGVRGGAAWGLRERLGEGGFVLVYGRAASAGVLWLALGSPSCVPEKLGWVGGLIFLYELELGCILKSYCSCKSWSCCGERSRGSNCKVLRVRIILGFLWKYIMKCRTPAAVGRDVAPPDQRRAGPRGWFMEAELGEGSARGADLHSASWLSEGLKSFPPP